MGLVVAHLIEVDVHALELELGGAIVPVVGGELSRSSPDMVIGHEVTYTPEASRPCSPEIVCLFVLSASSSHKDVVIRDHDDVPESSTDLVTLIVGVVLVLLLSLDRDGGSHHRLTHWPVWR